MDRLGKKTVHLARAVDNQPVLLAEFVHAEDGDDILQFAVLLQRLLHLARNPVVILPYDIRLENAGGGFQRIDRRIDALLGKFAAEHGVASRWAKVVAVAGSVRSSAGT